MFTPGVPSCTKLLSPTSLGFPLTIIHCYSSPLLYPLTITTKFIKMGAKRRRLAKMRKREKMARPKPSCLKPQPPPVLPNELLYMIYELLLPTHTYVVVHAHVNNAGVMKFTTSSPVSLELWRTSRDAHVRFQTPPCALW